MSDDTELNFLRVRLGEYDGLFKSPSTHALLKRHLGPVWDEVVQLHENQEMAARFLLTPAPFLEGARPANVVLSGEVGAEKFEAYLDTFHLGFH